MRLIHEKDNIKVFEKADESLVLKIGNGTEIHSIFNKEDIWIRPVQEHYWNFFSILPLTRKIKKVLIIGLAAGTISRQLNHLFNLEITGIEPNDDVISTAKQYFDLNNVNIINGKGEDYIKQTNEEFDLIIMDAFNGSNVVENCLNRKFFEECKAHLTSEGIFSINYIDEGSNGHQVRKFMLNTFDTVHSIPVSGSLNYILLGTEGELFWETQAEIKELKTIIKYVSKEINHVKGPTASCQLQDV